MDIGSLRNKIIIEKLDMVQDSFGQPVEQWNVFTTVWASINPLVGREYFAAETVHSEVTHKVRIRYRKGITPDMRIKFGDRYFTIITIINYQERNEELQIMCRELI